MRVQTGIFARRQTRAPKDIRGLTFPVEFKLVDVMDSPEAIAAAQATPNGTIGVEFKKPAAPYAVKVLLTVRNPPPLPLPPPPTTHSKLSWVSQLARTPA